MSLNKTIRHLNHRRIDLFRTIKLRLIYWICSPFNVLRPHEGDHYLVLRLDDKLGDSVASTGFLRFIKQHKSGVKLSVVAGPSTISLYKSLEFVDEVFESRKGMLSTLGLYFKLRRQRWDFIVNTSHILNPRVIFLVCCLRAFKKIGFENSKIRIFTDSVKIDFQKEHITDRYKNILAMMGVGPPSAIKYTVKLNEIAVHEIAEELSALKKKFSAVIALNSFAGGKLRNFNRQTTRQLVEGLSEFAIVSLANEGDHRILEQWNSPSLSNWFQYRKWSTLDYNLALAAASDLIVTPDTSWVHLAAALQKKTVAVYRRDRDPFEVNSVIWAPYGTQNKVVFADAKITGEDDINNIDIEKVLDEIRNLLNG